MSIELGILLKSTILLASAGLAACLLTRAPASLRHTLWLVTLGGLVLLPAAELLLPKVALPVLPREAPAVGSEDAGRAEPADFGAIAPATEARSVPSEGAAVAMETGPGAGPAFPWLAALWAAGAALVWVRFLVGARRLARLRRGSVACDAEWERALGSLRGAMGLGSGKRIVVRMSESPIPPMTWGLFGSTILLPASAREWTRERRTVVLAHELAHVRRRDGWSQLVAQIALGLYWFHPLVWCALGRMRLERERASDDRVIDLGASPQDYADHLLAVTRGMGGRPSPAAITMAAPSDLEARLRAILDPKVRRGDASRFLRAVLTLAVASIVLASASARVVAAVEQQPERAPEEAVRPGVATEREPAAPQPEMAAPGPEEAATAVATLPAVQQPASSAGETGRARARELLRILIESYPPEVVESPLPEGEAQETSAAQDESVTELPLTEGEVLNRIRATEIPPGVQEARPGEDERSVRRIRPNDLVQVHVYGEPELSVTVRVQPDGLMSMPLIQGLIAEGLTPGELAGVIREELRQYLQVPNVTVMLESAESYRVYVTGSVRAPGSYSTPTPATVLQALAMAGGFSDFANRRGIRIIRSQPGEEDRIFEFDYEAVISGASPGQNIRLEQDDVVVVP